MAEAELEAVLLRQAPPNPPSPSRSSSLFSAVHNLMAFPFKQQPQAKDPAAPTHGSKPRPQIPVKHSVPLSQFSSPAVSDSGWASENFMLGAGMVIIQPSSHKLVLVYDSRSKYWFLPKGRKDMGESLESAALREAYEESGYEVELLPLYTPSHAPSPPGDPAARQRPNTEPVYMTLAKWAPGQGNRKSGGEYLTSWYVGHIPEAAVHKAGTGMADEQTYSSHLTTYEDAMTLLYHAERDVLRYAWAVYMHTLKVQGEQRQQEERIRRQSANLGGPSDTSKTDRRDRPASQ
ncbi:hypothetical protein FPV67DRAFT_214024 [Lyophyllum atratum]|nr:hypothetical protein FPV67DRAFT_214024 [Lyophyllum atratum]